MVARRRDHRSVGARPSCVPELRRGDVGAAVRRRTVEERRALLAKALTSIRDIERELTTLRAEPGAETPYQRTSVMTHAAWVPPEWVEAAEDVLSGLAERHPSRTVVLFPDPDADDGLDGDVEVGVYPVGEGRRICTETIRIRLN